MSERWTTNMDRFCLVVRSSVVQAVNLIAGDWAFQQFPDGNMN